MPVELLERPAKESRPVRLITTERFADVDLPPETRAWAAANGFGGEAGRLLIVPAANGGIGGALFGLGEGKEGGLFAGSLAKSLPEGDWHFAEPPVEPALSALGLVLGGYAFTRYGKKPGKAVRFALPEGADAGEMAAWTVVANVVLNLDGVMMKG